MTFMQDYRAYKTMSRGFRATMDTNIVREFGTKRAQQFERYDNVLHQIVPCNVHMRINFRSEAAKRDDWAMRAAKLNKLWYSWK